ncbi:protease modulator HflC [Pararhizobium sp. IMCC21322]|uniref:protease modulator HflC n=1 Tax=Pararhizobium sp. IMCC21322 TaxID=3067903 RepID=UPI0027405B08|nr:protease modulator HflC [Pararhizobium sp. IMCC21322]
MKKSLFGGAGLVIIGVLVLLAYGSFFIVNVTQQALVLRFGEPVNVITSPGLSFKLPLIDNVVYIDKRILSLSAPAQEIIASDQKRIVVDAFARYKIVDPLRFFQAAGSEVNANQRLETVLNSATRRVLGEASFEELVRDDRQALMTGITASLNREASDFGVQVVDVRIRRADLPEANSQAVYQRMQTEREREATDIRARGEEAGRRIRSRADRDGIVIRAEAERDSQRVRGEGDAKRNEIFANAFGRDPEFFSFYRSMQAYERGLDSESTQLVISPNSEFFQFFASPGQAAEPSAFRETPSAETEAVDDEAVAPSDDVAPADSTSEPATTN